MNIPALQTKAEILRALHVPGNPLVLLNAWDATSAVVIARAGAPAIASTSAGAANALGYADGQHLTREQMLAAIAPIAAAVDVPVTADMEAGYGDAPEAAAATALGVLAVGAVGLNLEDTADAGPEPLLEIGRFVAKIAAIREATRAAGVEIVINARTDVFIGAVGDPATRLQRAIERGRAYIDAGADCIFVPAVDARMIGALVEGIGGPVSVLAGAGTPSLTELADLGVARISVGSGAYRSVVALARKMAEGAYGAGNLDAMLAAQVPFDEIQAFFATR
jgi:2-methylisocitrate lyase-like PEP mutase family enzyme